MRQLPKPAAKCCHGRPFHWLGSIRPVVRQWVLSAFAFALISLAGNAQTTNSIMQTERAYLGGGCFWCLDYFLCVFAQFMKVKNHAANFAATK